MKLLIFGWLLLASTGGESKDIRTLHEINGEVAINTPDFLITHDQPFYGLAFIYNAVQPIYLVNNEVQFVDPTSEFLVPKEASHVGWKSRYKLALLENSKDFEAMFSHNQLVLETDSLVRTTTHIGYIGTSAGFSTLKYAHLWDWLRAICLGIEWLLSTINLWVGHWGWSIVVLSVVMKIIMTPVSLLTLKFQRNVSINQSLLAPKLAEIKSKYKGEQAHNQMMAAHKELGITPFYSLKPMLSNLIQIPILVAIFNVLGEMSGLEGQPFLWVDDLSVADTLFNFGFAIPLFGAGFNLLPILMTLITLLSTVYYKNDLAPEAETSKQKLNLYFMAFGFFVLFYPFPASMVLYWAMANVLQFIQQKAMGN